MEAKTEATFASKPLGELRAIARECGVPMASRLSKQQLVQHLTRIWVTS